ncbi:MAG: methenyltetrahydromethanopterin cyclohydrolase [Candidatus Hodarchaeales archaeon]|jgi:methenyltetrahydromethanopterin cyclohydrolase
MPVSYNLSALNKIRNVMSNPREIEVHFLTLDNGTTIVDCGIHSRGSIQAGLLYTDVSAGGLATTSISYIKDKELGVQPHVKILFSDPVIGSLCCQAATWEIHTEEGFDAHISGPGRIIARKPKHIFKKIDCWDYVEEAILCLESDQLPDSSVVDEFIVKKMKLAPESIFILACSVNSMVGAIQLVARTCELSIFKLVEKQGFNHKQIHSSTGIAPLPPFAADKKTCMGNLNDTLMYGSEVWVWLNTKGEINREELQAIADGTISSATRDGKDKSFLDYLAEVNGDMTKLNADILGPARINLIDTHTGYICRSGMQNYDVLKKIFQIGN